MKIKNCFICRMENPKENYITTSFSSNGGIVICSKKCLSELINRIKLEREKI